MCNNREGVRGGEGQRSRRIGGLADDGKRFQAVDVLCGVRELTKGEGPGRGLCRDRAGSKAGDFF